MNKIHARSGKDVGADLAPGVECYILSLAGRHYGIRWLLSRQNVIHWELRVKFYFTNNDWAPRVHNIMCSERLGDGLSGNRAPATMKFRDRFQHLRLALAKNM